MPTLLQDAATRIPHWHSHSTGGFNPITFGIGIAVLAVAGVIWLIRKRRS